MSTTELKRGLLQFPHPGSEHVAPTTVMPWNTGEHRRKFLLSPGALLEEDQQVTRHDELCFWGEWEPPSVVVERWQERGRDPHLPRALHQPVLPDVATAPGKLQNSDPLVFGSAFRYSNCRQSTKTTHRPQKQQRLDIGSLILFGSKVGGGFVLDTCLVVASRTAYSLGDLVSPEAVFTAAVVGPLLTAAADDGWHDIEDVPLTLYAGATSQAPVEGMVSFVPALPRSAAPQGFARPLLRLPDGVLNHNLTQQTRLHETDDVRPLYDEVVRQVREQGLDLAVSLDVPAPAAP